MNCPRRGLAVHIAVVLALLLVNIRPSSAANATNINNATNTSNSTHNDDDEVECPQRPDRRICRGTPFAVLRDPASNCTFYDCPPAPPGYIDWTINKNNDEVLLDQIDAAEQEQQQQQPPPPPSSCTVCTDDPTANMKSRGLNCTTAIQALATRCVANAGWVAAGTCQSSCYFAGRGYDGDVCCPGDTAYPTMSPTARPSGTPTAHPSGMPTGGPSWAPTAVPTDGPTADGTTVPTLTVNGSNDDKESEVVCNSPFGPKKVGELYFTSDGCNYCICGDDGVPACTALICPGTPISSTSAPTSPPTSSPTASPTDIDVICPTDVLECDNNITLTRDPRNGCEFGPAATCPPTTLPPGTSYKCEEGSSGIYPVDMCLGFIWCQGGDYLAGPSLCPSGKRFDSSCQCCKDADEVNCEVGFGRKLHPLKEGEMSGVEKKGKGYLRK